MRDIAGTQPELPDPNAVVPNKVLFLMHTYIAERGLSFGLLTGDKCD